MGNDNYKYFAFIKISEEKSTEDFTKGLESMFLLLNSNGKQIPRSKIVIPMSKEIGSTEVIFKKIIDSIENVSSLKRILLTTTSSECFLGNIQAYTKVYQELVEDYRISIE